MKIFLSTQQPDTRPGNYYVSIIDGSRTSLALGPFPTHEAALLQVGEVREFLKDDPMAAFYAYGTARLMDEVEPHIGILNDEIIGGETV